MTICIQCALRALVNGLPSPTFEEEPEEHRRLYHPDLEATLRERKELLARVTLEDLKKWPQ